MRRRLTVLSVLASIAALLVALPGTVTAQEPDHSQLGRFSQPFEEPTINGQPTEDDCIEAAQPGDDHAGPHYWCKPAAGAMAVLHTDDIAYYNTLEDTEEVEASIVGEYGSDSIDDQARILDLDVDDPQRSTWRHTRPVDGDPAPSDDQADLQPLIPGLHTTETYNDNSLFCVSLIQLADGRLLNVGGTAYYSDPGIDGAPYGVVELEGLKDTRILAPDGTWSRTGGMNYGRWYPSVTTLPDGRVLVTSGVQKLLKPIYPDQEPTNSGRNVPQTETFDPATGEWTLNPPSADRSLPLYPRQHLLPNGDVYYNAGGQVYNPQGQGFDELGWNVAAAYDPATQTWQDLGIPGLGTTAPGFRGSTASIMLPLRPDEDGRYSQASFLTAGGILGTTPGTYFAVPQSRIDTVDTESMTLSSRETGSLNQARWYGTSVLAPTGEVFAFNGASADEVVGPGTAMPVTRAEVFDPETETWRELAEQHRPRTYHNTAALLPDGRVLVGGHAPISTLYTHNRTLVPGLTSPNEGRDPSLEIYEPPYLFRGERPEIMRAPDRIGNDGRTFKVVVDSPSEITEVMLVRNTAITHLVDGDQRTVELEIVDRQGPVLTVRGPARPAVAPAGPYMLFVNRATADGPVPSESAQLFVDHAPGGAASGPASAAQASAVTGPEAGPAPDRGVRDTERRAGGGTGAGTTSLPDGAVQVPAEVAFHEMAGAHDHVSAASGAQTVRTRRAGSTAPATGDRTVVIVVAVLALAGAAGTFGARRRDRAPVRGRGPR